MSKERFSLKEFESMSFDKVKTLFYAISKGEESIEEARLAAVKAKDDYNKHNEKNEYIKRVDSKLFDADLAINHFEDTDFKNRFKAIYLEYQKKYYNPISKKSQELWDVQHDKELAIKNISSKVYDDLQALSKSLGFPFYRRLNQNMDCFELNRLFRMCFQHLFLMVHTGDDLKYDMKESCLYTGAENKYWPLHQERDIRAAYNEFVKGRE